ncbi:MAG TPA: efflux RND transporter periplasmic adaptor subunit [Candidatus Krumholzibacteria bacterium]|nr:efflux RND transporter periplasmic adaptor subunit [Candidatus Krumholzibacteria bacterium]
MKRKAVLWTLAAVVVVAGGGAALMKTGVLPFGRGAVAGAGAALADTVAAGDTSGGDKAAGDKDAPPAVPVELALVEGRGISAYYRAASVVEADRLVDVVARSRGRVRTVAVEEGDWVEQGAVLAELENDRERIQLEKAELSLRDKARQLDRSRQMLDEALISRKEFDDQESACKLAEAERDLAAITLEETRVRAPFAGRITERKVVPGQQVEPGTPTFNLGDFTPLRVRVHLPEAVARKVHAGQRVLVAPESSDEDCEAVVERVAPVVDPATSTVRLTLLLDDAAGLRVGGFVKVRITTDRRQDALAVPKTALVEEGALRSVFVAEADTVRKVEIRTGLYDETHVEVLEGVFAGDRVVTMGQGGLRTGTHIEVLNAEAAGIAGNAPAADALARAE